MIIDICPMGNAWSDKPQIIDTGHQLSECSNMGTCDRRNVIFILHIYYFSMCFSLNLYS